MKTVGVVVNTRKPLAEPTAERVAEFLRKRDLAVQLSTQTPVEEIVRSCDLLICLGGDGTLLYAAMRMLERPCPVLGVNLGSLGFLTEVKEAEVFDELKAVLDGKYRIEERLMLRAHIKPARRGAEGERRFQALNDVVLSRENLARYLTIEVEANGEPLMSYSGDGVIVATPTGSTAYSLSAGGPLVYPTLDAFVTTPICAHALLMRPTVLPASRKITVRFSSVRASDQAVLTADGQERVVLSQGDVVEITKSAIPFQMIRSSKRSFLETVREKFGSSPL